MKRLYQGYVNLKTLFIILKLHKKYLQVPKVG